MEYGEIDKKITVDEMPETMIEEFFFRATDLRSDGPQIRKQWAIDKNSYTKETDTIILNFEHFSLHDKSHSRNILNAIGLLLGRAKVGCLSIGDLWLMLETAYFHDIGMAVTNEEIYDLWTKDNDFREFFQDSLSSSDLDTRKVAEYVRQVDSILLKRQRFSGKSAEPIEFDEGWPVTLKKYILLVTADYIRKKHAERSQKKMEKFVRSDNDIEPRLYMIVANISYLHTQNFQKIFELLEEKETCFGNSCMHPRFVAALLRIGDLLDMDNNRFDYMTLNHFGDIPHISELHLKKHKALGHFHISPEKISARAKSDDILVCMEIARWFQWLENENHNFIAYWNEFAPGALDGCTLSICDLKVYLKDDEFKMSFGGNYEINKKYALRLLIGDNIYENQLDFLREYIQNALDACKMEFGQEWKSGKLNHLLKDERKEAEACMPFDFKMEAFAQFMVRIEIKIVDNNLELSIIDTGLGIEEKGLAALTTIGSGWKNRRGYQDWIKDLVYWLKPTAGFGIGIQAAFMVSDEVEFFTKARKEAKGNVVKLKNPSIDGSVIYQGEQDLKNGTTVKIQVPLYKFMEQDIYKQRYPQAVSSHIATQDFVGKDSFQERQIMETIVCRIKSFLSSQLLNAFFPIEIKDDMGNKKCICSEFWYKEKKREESDSRPENEKPDKLSHYQLREFREIRIDEKSYFYDIEKNYSAIHVIDGEANRMISLAFSSGDKGVFKYAFKGISVIDEWEECYFFQGMMDILDGEVKEFLKVNRREFLKSFAKREIQNSMIVAALQIYLGHIGKVHNKWQLFYPYNLKLSNQFSNMLLSFIKYSSELSLCKDFLQEIKKDWQENEEWFVKYTVLTGKVSWEDNNFTYQPSSEPKNLIGLLLDVVLEEKILLVETKEKAEYNIGMSEDKLRNEYMVEWCREDLLSIWKQMEKEAIYVILDRTNRSSMIEDIFGKEIYIVTIGEKNFKVYGKNKKEGIPVKQNIDFDQRPSEGQRLVIPNPREYKILHVNAIPFTEKDKDVSCYLITPINELSIRKIDAAIKQEKTFDEFYQIYEDPTSMEAKELERIVDWVYHHQCDQEKRRKAELKEEYKRLIHDYYRHKTKQYLEGSTVGLSADGK